MNREIIGRLMWLANSEGKGQVWYSLKEKLCKKFGKVIGTDVQYLSGKECYSCNGTGKYYKYDWRNDGGYYESCYHCYNGWYKRPMIVLLDRISVGRHVFHRPATRHYLERELEQSELPPGAITGYIEHERKKNGWIAFIILYIVFDWKGYKAIVRSKGIGYCDKWFYRDNIINNIRHIQRKKRNAIPFRDLQGWKLKLIDLIFGKKPEPILDEIPF